MVPSLCAVKGLGGVVWAWGGRIQISVPFGVFSARVQAESFPQHSGLFTVVATPPVLHDAIFGVQHLAAQHAVESVASGEDPAAPGVRSLPFPAVRREAPLDLGDGRLVVAAAAPDEAALLVQLPPEMGGVFDQLNFRLATRALWLAVAESDSGLLPVHVQQVHLHVCKGGRDSLALAAFNLQLLMILFFF